MSSWCTVSHSADDDCWYVLLITFKSLNDFFAHVYLAELLHWHKAPRVLRSDSQAMICIKIYLMFYSWYYCSALRAVFYLILEQYKSSHIIIIHITALFPKSSSTILLHPKSVGIHAAVWLVEREVFPKKESKNSSSWRSHCKFILMRPLWSLPAALWSAIVEIMRTLCQQLTGTCFSFHSLKWCFSLV